MFKFKFKVYIFSTILLAFFTTRLVAISEASSIALEDGAYNGIFIGIDGSEVKEEDCSSIISKLQIVLPLLSEKLYQATEGLAGLGQVNILLPRLWSRKNCNIPNNTPILQPGPNQIYENTHIQITQNHPMTANEALPWTKQYRPCRVSSDSIIVPLSFLLGEPTSSGFSDSLKANVLLHEWTKFRYGVFDEIGYDEISERLSYFPPCYTQDQLAYLNHCTDSPVRYEAVAANASACKLEFLLSKSNLLEDLAKGSTSIMSVPYIDSVVHFCNRSTHNSWSPNKQNLFCNRSSIAEVVFSHFDFSAVTSERKQAPVTNFRFFQHIREFDSAYAFLIENSQDMRDQYKIQHVKQAIAQFLQILEFETEVYVITFSGDEVGSTIKTRLRSDKEKQQVLDFIPDRNSASNFTLHSPRLLVPVINRVVRDLNVSQDFFWNVFLFSDSLGPTNNDLLEAIDTFKETPHTISIFTFESDSAPTSISQQWLRWYAIPNTKNVVALPYLAVPYCPHGGSCSLHTSSFILDQFVGVLNNPKFGSRFLQNPAGQVVIRNQAGQRAQFQLQSCTDPCHVKKNFFFMSIPQEITPENLQGIKLIPPTTQTGGTCTTEILLDYSLVLTFSCTGTMSGQWSIELEEPIPPKMNGDPMTIYLHVWMELEENSVDPDNGRFVVIPSFGLANPSVEFSPNQNRVPVYVALQTRQGYPVLEADVRLQVYHPFLLSNIQTGMEVILRDDGDSSVGTDQTGNDGVYSAFLSGFSVNNSSFHLVRLKITTTTATKILEKIETSRAIQLNENMTGKCCGRLIRPLETRLLQPQQIKFQTLHLGFKTLEPWNQQRAPPGSVITQIKILEDTDEIISVEFAAVSAGNGLISSYQACCVYTNATALEVEIPGASNCKTNTMDCGNFEDSGFGQTCTLNKRSLVSLWVPVQDRSMVNRLICGLRAVNNEFELGLVSSSTFEMDVTAAVQSAGEIGGGEANGQQNCEKFSLSDKCLPIWIFWVMIGCLGFLVLIILLLMCCWCYSNKRKTKDKPVPKPRSVARENVLAVHYTPPPHTSDSFQGSPKPTFRQGEDEDSKVVKELFVNHAYIHDGDGEIKIITDNGQILRKPKTENERHSTVTGLPIQSSTQPSLENNMQVFKPVPMPKPNRIARSTTGAKSRGNEGHRDRPEIIHANPMLKSDSSVNTPPIWKPPQQNEPSPPRNSGDPTLVYATISRSGRFKSPPHQQPDKKQVTFDPHYMVPHNSTAAVLPVPIPQASQRYPRDSSSRVPKPSPPQLPSYPRGADSDTSTTDYDHVQRRRRMPPRFTKPPPYPTGSQLQLVAHQNLQRPVDANHQLRGMTHPGQTPLELAPVPPPRIDRMVNHLNNGAGQNLAAKNEMSSDDDSDEWDDGDNYEFHNTTGVSYA